MEGTLGAADCAPLRGGACEAALQGAERESAPALGGIVDGTRQGVAAVATPATVAPTLATRGARVDRAGVKLLPRAIADRRSRESDDGPASGP